MTDEEDEVPTAFLPTGVPGSWHYAIPAVADFAPSEAISRLAATAIVHRVPSF
jgi:hypothetical protein